MAKINMSFSVVVIKWVKIRISGRNQDLRPKSGLLQCTSQINIFRFLFSF
jgi:hypothetical protein